MLGSAFDLYEGSILAMRAVDLTRDGSPELLLTADGYLSALTGDLQAELWKSPYLGVLPGESDSIEIVDADDDAAIEIVVGIRFGLVAFEPTFQFVFSDGFESGDMSAWSSTLP